MEIFCRFLILLILPTISYGQPNFEDLVLKKCALTEYKKFIECVEDLISTNTKQPTANSCKLCDCDRCKREDHGGFSENNCCRNCCPFKPCNTWHCCFKTCHSGCESAVCRYSCRNSCFSYVEKGNRSNKSDSSRMYEEDALNITTKININNVINNTNSFEIPVRLNSNNRNEIIVDNEDNHENVLMIRDSTRERSKCEPRRNFPFLKCNFNMSSHAGNSSIKNTYKSPREMLCGNSDNCSTILDTLSSRYLSDVDTDQTNLTMGNNESLPLKTPIYSSFTWSHPMQSFVGPAYTNPAPNYYSLYSGNPYFYPYQFHSPNSFANNVPMFVQIQNSPYASYTPYQNSYMRIPYTTFPTNYQYPFVPYRSPQISFQPYENYPMSWTNFGRTSDYSMSQQFVPFKN